MKKINENKFWQELVSEFYTQGQFNQESYNCLNVCVSKRRLWFIFYFTEEKSEGGNS